MIYLNGLNAISVLGTAKDEVLSSLQDPNFKGLKPYAGYLPDGQMAYLGAINLPNVSGELRNITLLNRCLSELKPILSELKKLVKPERIGIVIGTSTSALTDVEIESRVKIGEPLPFDPRVYEIGIISEHVRASTNVLGPCYTVATACSSSARAIISARNLIRSGLCDAVIAGGSDSLSKVTVSGFFALSALDLNLCRPFAYDRNGINIGEGAGLCVVSKMPLESKAVKLLGCGATTDAYHVSAPDPNADGAKVAVLTALKDANLKPSDIGYINMHGTGTKLNDAMEGKLVRDIFGDKVPVSSIKHLTGHTLGAAGIVEASLLAMILQNEIPLPYHPYAQDEYVSEFGDIDLVVTCNRGPKSKILMSNNFAFGGNNTSLILGLD